MLFSHAIIVTANESRRFTRGNVTLTSYSREQLCVNPREQLELFGDGGFANVYVSSLYLLYFAMGITAVFGNVLVITSVLKFAWLKVWHKLLDHVTLVAYCS